MMVAHLLALIVFQILVLIVPTIPPVASESIRSRGVKEIDRHDNNHQLLGEYSVVEILDPNGFPLWIPGVYLLHITRAELAISSTILDVVRNTYVFRLNLRVGNMISGTLVADMPIKGQDDYLDKEGGYRKEETYRANVLDLFSTRIHIPPQLEDIELGMRYILTGTTKIGYNGNTLRFYSDEGQLSFRRTKK